jgi:MoxR-like ATPase
MNDPIPDPEALRYRLYLDLAAHLATRGRAEMRARYRRATSEEWCEIRHALARKVIAPPDHLDTLSTWVLAARSGHPLRLLLVGPPGSGKSHTARAMADVIGPASVAAALTEMAEAGWGGGVHLAEVIRSGTGGLVNGGTLILDEVDKIAVRAGLSETSASKYRGQISLLLSLLDREGHVLLEGGTSVRSAGMNVILTGAFADAPWAGRMPTCDELRAYGVTAEVLDRIDHVLALTPPPPEALARIVMHSVGSSQGLLALASSLGFEVRIDDAALRYAARIHGTGPTSGTRTARAAVEAAVLRVLTRALQVGGLADGTLTVAPDDVAPPPPSPRGRDTGGFGRASRGSD